MTNFIVAGFDFLCFSFWFIGMLPNYSSTSQQPLLTMAMECTGVESFERVNGVKVSPGDRIPLFSSSNGAITADCYNRCRSSSGCPAFWIDYNTSACFRLPQLKTDYDTSDASSPTAYFERMCLFGDICSKAWIAERVPGYQIMGYDDVIIRSVVSRKRCIELCLMDKKLPCRSAEYWATRKECRLSREDRRSQPGAFIKTSSEVDYIENSCNELEHPDRGSDCEWEIMRGFEFTAFDFISKATSLEACQKACEEYLAFTCRSVTFDEMNELCFLSGTDITTTSSKLLNPSDKKFYAQRVPCVDMTLECLGESMVARLKSHSPFYGKMFSPTSADCEAFGRGKMVTTIAYPLNGCGIQKEFDGTFVGTLIVQQHPLIQKRGDSAFRLVCSFPEANRTLSRVFGFGSESPRLVDTSVSASVPGGPGYSSILTQSISSSILINSTAKSPGVTLRILDSSGEDVTGVSLGDELWFKVDVESQSAYGIIARDLIAKSGTNQDELILLDSRGCPEDPAIFPYLRRESDRTKSLKTRFEAFKFTNDAVVRFQVHLQFCRHECAPVMCDGDSSFGKKRKKRMASMSSDITGEFELKKEIIVLPRSTHRLPSHLKGLQHMDSTEMSPPQSDGDNRNKKSTEICSSKEVVIGTIVGFTLLQIVIVMISVLWICHKHKDKTMDQSNTTFPATSSSYRYHHRQHRRPLTFPNMN